MSRLPEQPFGALVDGDVADRGHHVLVGDGEDRVRGGTVVLDVPNGHMITQQLAHDNVLVDYRPGAGIRVAPHFYTLDEEIDRTIDAIVTARRAALPAAVRV